MDRASEKDFVSINEYLNSVNGQLSKIESRIIGEVMEVQLYPGRSYLFFKVKDKDVDNPAMLTCMMWKRDYEISDTKAKNIALDQTRKAYAAINKERMTASGYDDFEWLHSGGGMHPRKSHVEMNGKIYSFDKLPVINKEQVDRGYEAPIRGIPGQAFGCGCTMIPVYRLPTGERI